MQNDDSVVVNSLNAELIPISHLLALLETHHILYISRIRVSSKSRKRINGEGSPICVRVRRNSFSEKKANF